MSLVQTKHARYNCRHGEDGDQNTDEGKNSRIQHKAQDDINQVNLDLIVDLV